MKGLFVFIFIISITFVSCDGRHKAYQTPKDNLKEHKLYKSFAEHVKYIPEAYFETTTDTILSNGFQVKITSYTDMQTSYLHEFTKDSINHKAYYRNINNTISILKNNKEITSKLITKDVLISYNSSFKNDLKNKVIQGIWLNQYASTITNKVTVNVLFQKPGTNDKTYYTLSFNDNGSFNIVDELKQEYI
ncbi:MAG: hypothetical protein K9I95_06920 [Flavobacteriaceae bacterium]|nr:hypothetical protein [Flavobacteriaceae bacterium]